MKNDVNWTSGNYGIADILIRFTGKNMGGTGCTNTIPSSGGTHPYIMITNYSSDMARTVMHEVSHTYGLQHNTSSCSTQIPGIMASACPGSIYIKNWTPSEDTTMGSNRNWYY